MTLTAEQQTTWDILNTPADQSLPDQIADSVRSGAPTRQLQQTIKDTVSQMLLKRHFDNLEYRDDLESIVTFKVTQQWQKLTTTDKPFSKLCFLIVYFTHQLATQAQHENLYHAVNGGKY